MPLYEFVCSGCGQVFEELVSGSKKAEAACPSCGKAGQRKLSVFAAQTRESCGQSAKSCDVSPGGGGGCCGGSCPHAH